MIYRWINRMTEKGRGREREREREGGREGGTSLYYCERGVWRNGCQPACWSLFLGHRKPAPRESSQPGSGLSGCFVHSTGPALPAWFGGRENMERPPNPWGTQSPHGAHQVEPPGGRPLDL